MADRVIICPNCQTIIDTLSKKISCEKLLLVEGKDDEFFFEALIDYIGLMNIQIFVIGGTDRNLAKKKIRGLKNDPQFNQVTSLGYIRDADINAKDTFKSIQNILKNSGLPVPKQVLKPSQEPATEGQPVVRIMIVPPGRETGMIEDLCLEAVKEDPATECVNQYFKCLQRRLNGPKKSKIAKAKTRVFIASREDPTIYLGTAAKKGYWPFDDNAFNEIKSFIRSL